MTTRRGTLGRLPAILGERRFRRFWLGQTISVFGDQITYLAVPIVAVLMLGATPGDMGLLTAASLLPALLFSLPGGVWLDRVHRRRRLMVFADLGRAALIALVPVAFALHALSLPLLLGISFLIGSIAVAFNLAWMTMFASVARREQYVAANALLNGSRSVSAVGGPAVGGVLIQVLGAPIALLADALSFLASAFFLSRIDAPDAPVEHDPGSIREQLTSGMSFVLRDPILRPSILGVATMNLFNYCYQALFILFATTYLHVDPGVLGLLLGVGAVGGVIGAVIGPRVGRRLGVGGAFTLALVIFPGATILVPIALGQPYPVVLALLFLAEFVGGLGVMILDINGGSLLISRTPDRLRGRAGGAFSFINVGIRPIGAVIGGALGTLIGVHETLWIVTFAQLSGLLWLVRSPIPGLRDLPDAPD
ncbi:MAG TPA: MFS transporter [Candidatus Limnocylindrales bacterium]|nr:MFS transporter [Candidatus Limnocylindrales bacterium]